MWHTMFQLLEYIQLQGLQIILQMFPLIMQGNAQRQTVKLDLFSDENYI